MSRTLTLLWATVLSAASQVLKAVGVALAAAIVEGLTLHAGHIEEVGAEQGSAGTFVLGEPAHLGDFCVGGEEERAGSGGGECETEGGHVLRSRPSGLTGDPEAGLLALQVALEVIGVALTASVVEELALLREGVVEVALDTRLARTLVYLEQTGTWM